MAISNPYSVLCKRSSTTTTRLYEGPDHLLYVKGTYSEEYRRFFYKDIQSALISRSPRGAVANILLCLIIGFFGLLAFSEPDTMVGFAVITAPFIVLLIYNVISGQWVDFVISTAVQRERITCLHRRRKAEKVLANINARIAEAQGALEPAATESTVSESAAEPGAPQPEPESFTRESTEQEFPRAGQ